MPWRDVSATREPGCAVMYVLRAELLRRDLEGLRPIETSEPYYVLEWRPTTPPTPRRDLV